MNRYILLSIIMCCTLHTVHAMYQNQSNVTEEQEREYYMQLIAQQQQQIAIQEQQMQIQQQQIYYHQQPPAPYPQNSIHNLDVNAAIREQQNRKVLYGLGRIFKPLLPSRKR